IFSTLPSQGRSVRWGETSTHSRRSGLKRRCGTLLSSSKLMETILSPSGLVFGDGDLLRAVDRWGNENLWSQAGIGEICRGHFAPEITHGCALYQIDGAAAKPSAGHARANQAWLCSGNFHHQIEFLAADFVVVPEAVMRIAHQLPEGLAIFAAKCLDRALHTCVFCNNMAAACKYRR